MRACLGSACGLCIGWQPTADITPDRKSFTGPSLLLPQALLTACMKLFFKRPPETRHVMQPGPPPGRHAHPTAISLPWSALATYSQPLATHAHADPAPGRGLLCPRRKALGAALAAGVADPAQEVHDKALLYYRLLQHSVGAAQQVVDVPRPAVTSFADAQSAETQVGWQAGLGQARCGPVGRSDGGIGLSTYPPDMPGPRRATPRTQTTL